MPGVDMSPQQLDEYEGMGMAPADFLSFWKNTKEKIQRWNYTIIRKQQIFKQKSLRYEKILVQAPDGTMLSGKFICPIEEKKYPLVLSFHDYPESSRSWFYLSRYAAAGYAVLAPDCRGQGGESGSGVGGVGSTAYGPMFQGLEGQTENMYLYHLYEDALLWVEAAKQLEFIKDTGMVTYGDGQGGALAIVCGSLYSEISKCAANYPLLCDYRRVWEMDFDTNAYAGLNYYFRWKDPLHQTEQEIFDKLSYLDIRHFAPYVKGETIIGTGLQDLVSPPSAQYAVFHGLQCKKQHYVYPKYGHERNNFFENTWFQFLLKAPDISSGQQPD